MAQTQKFFVQKNKKNLLDKLLRPYIKNILGKFEGNLKGIWFGCWLYFFLNLVVI